MELQFQTSTQVCLEPKTLDVHTEELTQEVRLSDGMPDVGRVLSTGGQVIISSKQWQDRFATVTGGVAVRIIYTPEDEAQPRCLESWIPFQVKLETAESVNGGAFRVSALLRYADCRSVTSRKLMVRAGVSVMVQSFIPIQLEIRQPGELPEDIQLLQNTYPLHLYVEAGEKVITVDEELSIPLTDGKPEKLLNENLHFDFKEIKVSGDKLILRGNIGIHLVYRDPDGYIRTADLEQPFYQYAQLENTYSNDAKGDVLGALSSAEVELISEMKLRLKCGIIAQYAITDRSVITLTQDAYSMKDHLTLQTAMLPIPSIISQRTEDISVQQTASLPVRDVVDICVLPDFPQSTCTPEGVDLELPVVFQLLYISEDGTLQGASMKAEGHVKIPANPDVNMCYSVEYPVSKPYRLRSEQLLEADYRLQFTAVSTEQLQTVCGFTVCPAEATAKAKPSFILRRSEGESLWTIAKQAGSTVADIERINGLDGACEPDRMLIIPVK